MVMLRGIDWEKIKEIRNRRDNLAICGNNKNNILGSLGI